MMTSYLLDGEFKEQQFSDFTKVADALNKNRKKIYDLKLDAIIELLSNLGRKIVNNDDINTIPGVSYISLWMRKDNLKRICKLNYLDPAYFEDFKDIDGIELCVQPRGIVCHWVAYTIPTLAFFSLVQSILSKNASIVKVPEENKDIILSILKNLSEIEIKFDGKTVSGADIVKSICIVSFDGKDKEISSKFSLASDCKVIWGGSESIKAVAALPQKEHCETITFGPKYSFGVFDKDYIESDSFDKSLENAVMDIVLFNQMACSSPHVFFFEKSKYSIKEIAHKMKSYFEKLPHKFTKQELPQNIATTIINTRGVYSLDEGKDILNPDDLSWTILIDKELKLEEPVQGRCIFIKEVDSLDVVLDLITRKIQAMSVCILDTDKKREFAKKATYQGADRIVVPGHIHDFDLPWDGILALNRLVRWTVMKTN